MVRQALDKLEENEQGVVMLLSVLIATVVGIAIGISVISGGLILTQGSQVQRESISAKQMANACAEAALQQIRTLTSYSGSGTVTISGQTCSYTVTHGTGQNRTIQSSATLGMSTQRNTVQITTINPKIVISSWIEQ